MLLQAFRAEELMVIGKVHMVEDLCNDFAACFE